MMEYAICVLVGFFLCFFTVKREKKPTQKEVSKEEQLRAKKALHEYQNFMNYDGFSSQEE